MGKTVSIKKSQASRRNALRSTGPRSPMGKRIAGWNALKHGLLANEVVIPAGEGKERRSKYAALLARLRDDLRPLGALEELLVEKIAICYWRLRRLLRCETGEIRKGLDTASTQVSDDKAGDLERAQRFAAAGVDAARRELLQSSLGLESLIRLLEQVSSQVKEMGYLSKESYPKLVENFGVSDDSLANRCLRLSPIIDTGKELVGMEDPERAARLLEMLREEKARLEALKPAVAEQEKLQQQSHVASLSLPTREAAEKIVRYAASVERELHRTIQQLVRLQKHRKGG